MPIKSVLALIAVAAVAQTPIGYPAYNRTKTLYAKNDLRGKPAPRLQVAQWLKGAQPDLKGKVLVLDFWATWCPPCREAIPELNAFARRFGKDVVVVGVSDEKPEVVRAFIKTTPMDYLVAVDPDKRMSKLVGVEGIPHVLVVSPDGVVRWQGFPLDGADRLDEKLLGRIVAAAKVPATR